MTYGNSQRPNSFHGEVLLLQSETKCHISVHRQLRCPLLRIRLSPSVPLQSPISMKLQARFRANGDFAVLFAALCLIGAFLGCGGGNMQAPISSSSGFRQTNLVSDTAGTAAHNDPNLLNPWGIAFEPGLSFWIAVNNRGSAKVVDPAGRLRAIQHSADRHADICNLRRARRHRD